MLRNDRFKVLKNIIILFFLFVNTYTKAQLKTDVLVLGATASGTACAIQAARSGVKVILIEPTESIVSINEPNLNILAFNSGIWREWKNQIDSCKTTPRNTLENIVKKVKNLQLFKNANLLSINHNTNGYTARIMLNGKQQEIKTKLLVDASQNILSLDLKKFDIPKSNLKNEIKALAIYNSKLQNNKLYRTSVAAGFGLDSTQIFAIPVGVFIPSWDENLLILHQQTAYTGTINSDNFNLALWVNIGQAAGTLAAYGPFFKQPTSKANIRMLQSEILNYKGQILPITDVNPQDSAYKAIERNIISSVLKLDFNTGNFYPDSLVDANDVKPALSDLFTRAKLWYAENPNKPLNLENLISLFSFISTREQPDIEREITEKWNNKYGFLSSIYFDKSLSRKQFAVLVNDYLQPYKVRVDFEGNFLK